MTKLIAVISPAKLLDDKTHYPQITCSSPVFLKEAEELVLKLRKQTPAQLSKMMDISAALSQTAREQFQHFQTPFTHQNAHPALLMFKGEVYRGLAAEHFNQAQLNFADDHLRILSGLYGVLKPLDLAMPYRLMMGTSFQPKTGIKNLYEFWSEKVTEELDQTLDKKGVLVNLASGEYFRVINTKKLERTCIHVEFMEKKGTDYKVVSTYAKLARGKMARFLIEHKISNVKNLMAFDVDGYTYNKNYSSTEHYVFTRG
jgi:uncharacterized protein